MADTCRNIVVRYIVFDWDCVCLSSQVFSSKQDAPTRDELYI
jgi:hypothetical protein